MKLHQKVGIALMAVTLVLGIILQKSAALLYRPDSLTNLEIVPTPPDLTLFVLFLSTNWFVVAPLVLLFVVGVVYASFPKRLSFDEPQLIEIKYFS